jgi:23S rRNA (guanosine2251-2'-O)-methyltransferase
MYLYGKNSVLERLRINPQTIREIYVQDNFRESSILKKIGSLSIPVKRVLEKDLMRMKRADRLQGIIAKVRKFSYAPFRDLLLKREGEQMSLLFLDGINDPHNLGSIMRIAACFGNFALVIPKHGSCEVNETAIHVASGGENHVPVSLVTNLATALREAKDAGYWAVGTVIEGGEDINKVSLPFPLCLILGSEGRGIRHGLHKLLDLKVSLPMKGAQLSLNVAMACAVFAHEIVKHRP